MERAGVLPPEVIREVLGHLGVAGRELAAALAVSVRALRRALEQRSGGDPDDPSTVALEESLRWLERGLAYLEVLFPAPGEVSEVEVRRRAEEIVRRVVDEAASRTGVIDERSDLAAARDALLAEVRRALGVESGS